MNLFIIIITIIIIIITFFYFCRFILAHEEPPCGNAE